MSYYWCTCIGETKGKGKNAKYNTLSFQRTKVKENGICVNCGYYAVVSKEDLFPTHNAFHNALEKAIYDKELIDAKKRGVLRPTTSAWGKVKRYRAKAHFDNSVATNRTVHMFSDDSGHAVYMENIDFGLEKSSELDILA